MKFDSRISRILRGLASACLIVAVQAGHAHGIAGDRYFPGTMTFDDPAVADELLFQGASFKRPADGVDATDQAFSWSFMRLLTPTVGIGMDGGRLRRDWGPAQRAGLTPTSVTVKTEVLRDDLHETLVSTGLSVGLPRSGSQAIGANTPTTVEPGIFFGQGFGDAPDAWSWLRPLGVAGAVTMTVPTRSSASNLAFDPGSGGLTPVTTKMEPTLHWGFALEYSMLYRTHRFAPGVLPRE